MNPLLMTGTRIVVLALLAYSAAFFLGQRKKKVTRSFLMSQSLGLGLDISATVFMVLGSTNSPFTIHGFLGYSALAGMIVETILIWRLRLTQGPGANTPGNIHTYAKFAYIWWVVAFVAGGLMVLLGSR